MEKSLIKLTEHIYILPIATNIGVIAFSEEKQTEIYLIDSGNDDEYAKVILKQLQASFSNPLVKTIINTHSHADHCGGNEYIRKETGCTIWASDGEAGLMEHPDIETGLIWGGNPVKELKNSYFVAKPCKADKTFKNNETFSIKDISVEVISLNGHYLDQTGFVITDTDGKKVCFAGDALSGRNVIKKYWIQYLFDEGKTKKSLERLSKVQADFYVPGHGNYVDSIDGIIELNEIALLETENMIIDELSSPKTTEQILKAVADRNGIRLGLSQYVLIGCTLRSYLSSLSDEGKIKYEISHNMMYWSAVKK